MARRQEWYTANDDGDLSIDNDNGGFTAISETFTLGTTGNNLTFNVTQIKVMLDGVIGAALTQVQTWEIQGTLPDGKPDGNVISTGTLDTSIVTTTEGWYTITMSAGTLEASKTYALVAQDGYTDGTNNVTWSVDETAPAYTGGSVWTSANAGVAWTEVSTKDFMFQIEGGSYEGTLCSLADAVNKAGANASTGSTEEVLVSDFVRQAEGVINAITRYNWVDQYASISDDTKFILNQVASDLAAIYIITYDMAGYTDRVEAETMINVYRETVMRGLSLLKNQEVKDFINDA